MKIGEIWEYKGKDDYTPDKYGRHWKDDDYGDSYWLMDRVIIIGLLEQGSEEGEWSEAVEIAPEDGGEVPMEAAFLLPKSQFLKEYRKVYK